LISKRYLRNTVIREYIFWAGVTNTLNKPNINLKQQSFSNLSSELIEQPILEIYSVFAATKQGICIFAARTCRVTVTRFILDTLYSYWAKGTKLVAEEGAVKEQQIHRQYRALPVLVAALEYSPYARDSSFGFQPHLHIVALVTANILTIDRWL